MSFILNTSPIFPLIRYRDERKNEIRIDNQAHIININIRY